MEKALIGQQDVLQPQSRLSQLIINSVSAGRSESLWPGQEVSNWALSARPRRCWETLLLSPTPCRWISADEDIDCVTAGNVDVELSLKGAREAFIGRPGHTTALSFSLDFYFFVKCLGNFFKCLMSYRPIHFISILLSLNFNHNILSIKNDDNLKVWNKTI